jgi:hypothetical protein
MGLRFGDVPINLAKPSFKRPNRLYSVWWLTSHGTSQTSPYMTTLKPPLSKTSFPTDMPNINGKYHTPEPYTPTAPDEPSQKTKAYTAIWFTLDNEVKPLGTTSHRHSEDC